MNSVFYFTSTGNSLYIAKYIKDTLGGSVTYINADTPAEIVADKVIIVSPVYSFGLPVPVIDFIGRLTTDAPIYIVLNYGGMVGKAYCYAYSLCKERGLKIYGVYTVQMPENFTLTFTQPKFYSKLVLDKAPKKLDVIVNSIRENKVTAFKNPKKSKTTEQFLKNKDNWHKLPLDYSVTDDCVKCGKCVELCPTENISLVDGKIIFADKCIACIGCYHRCPKKAIRYKGKKKRDRYINPLINEADIGKSFE